jgi:hypothetical protein
VVSIRYASALILPPSIDHQRRRRVLRVSS